MFSRDISQIENKVFRIPKMDPSVQQRLNDTESSSEHGYNYVQIKRQSY